MLIVKQWRQWRRDRSRWSAFWSMFFLYLEVLFINLKSKGQRELAESKKSLRYWYPHVRWGKFGWADIVRIPIQTLWLLVFQTNTEISYNLYHRKLSFRRYLEAGKEAINTYGRSPYNKISALFARYFKSRSQLETTVLGNIWRAILLLAALFVALLIIQVPMDARAQGILLLFFWAVALWVRNAPGRIPMIMMMFLSVLVSTRYLYWRVTQTINWDEPLDATLGLILLTAELYAWTILLLGYVQTIWPLRRGVVKLPENLADWPTIDVFIPSYNEPLQVVRHAVLAAQMLDWPRDKITIHLLDDGRRAEFKVFCDEIGVNYIVREDNTHAKAGNLNHALKQTSGDYVAIFDCDHIPTRGFLQLTMGWFFADSKLALVQTPHHFFSADPFERNLSVFRQKPNEGALFYGLIQDGNDMWNASFFCGSCAVIKRKPLEEVGGIAVETVTEDAHTALKLHRLGYTSAYLNIPLAAGLATDSLAAHIGQRIRWARGMAQIFRIDNPLKGKGLNWGQRVCYANAMLYFLNGIPRVIFLLAPLAFLLLQSHIVFAPAIMIAMYAIPHLIHSNLANSRAQGRYRHSFWAEMYETVLAWYILRPTTVALLAPNKGTFNVTAKEGNLHERYYDWKVSGPYLALIGLSVVGLGWGVYRLLWGPSDELLTVVLNLFWITYNLIILGGAVAVSEEAKQVRYTHRVSIRKPVSVMDATERVHQAELVDYSHSGAGLLLPDDVSIEAGEKISITLPEATSITSFEAKVISQRERTLGIRFVFNSREEERAFLRATFARADAWVGWHPKIQQDQLVNSFKEVLRIGVKGYQRVALQVAPQLGPIIKVMSQGWRFIASLMPRSPEQGR